MKTATAFALGAATGALVPLALAAAYVIATLRVQCRNWGTYQWANNAREGAWQ